MIPNKKRVRPHLLPSSWPCYFLFFSFALVLTCGVLLDTSLAFRVSFLGAAQTNTSAPLEHQRKTEQYQRPVPGRTWTVSSNTLATWNMLSVAVSVSLPLCLSASLPPSHTDTRALSLSHMAIARHRSSLLARRRSPSLPVVCSPAPSTSTRLPTLTCCPHHCIAYVVCMVNGEWRTANGKRQQVARLDPLQHMGQ